MKNGLKRVLSLLLALAMVVGYVPVTATAAEADGIISTVADPETLTRPQDIYGDNTLNAGKITVGKSVSDTTVKLSDSQSFTPAQNNFLVTVSQSAQVAGLTSEMSVPVDVVFVLDTSNSMTTNDKIGATLSAANTAIKSLMSANDYNRVAVVAFSGTQGGGSASGESATVLTQLGHYDAVDNHIYRVNNRGNVDNNGTYIRGQGSNSGWRLRTSQGTNIHAGVAVGGQILAGVEDTTVTLPNGQTLTRMPFLVVMSDGAASIAADNGSNNGYWFRPSNTETIGDIQEVDGLNFLAALTAAYYKGLITENYYGTNASEDNRCYVYTMGLGLSSGSLAEVTMNPSKTYTNNSSYNAFLEYWRGYQSGADFTVDTYENRDRWGNVTSTDTHTIPAASITATEKYVYGTGLGYSGSFRYNDAYFSASQASDMADAFNDVMAEISKKSVSSPTKITTTPEFSGYVTFTDPIGEFMEVKNIKGIYANGVLYSGATAAACLSNRAANAEFNEALEEVLHTRLTMAQSQNVGELVEQLIKGRADSNNIKDNSITWWGNTLNEDGSQVQCLDYADNDTIAYITDPDTKIPAGADVLCRSYFYYGTAGGTASAAQTNHNYMYFVVRVQRELVAPYRQTVVISAPASLLSVEKVMITEDENGNYTAEVTEAAPARVIYEVGLRSDIDSYNVESVVSEEYKEYKTEGNMENGNYVFYTNDWDRTASGDAHHKAMAKATFDAAQDNPFYAYQENTLIYVKSGDTYIPYTGTEKPSGSDYAYLRTYYDWEGETATNGVYPATQKTEFIPITIPDNSGENVFQNGSNWYIKAGVYTASSLVVNGDDTAKEPNLTGTATIVAHPHRTNTATDSHYTVLLGNNGKLTIKAQEFKKNVAINPDDSSAQATVYDDDGKAVTIGDILEYQIVLPNEDNEKVTMTVTDTIPAGTVYVANSASDNGAESNGVITWTDVAVPQGGKTLTFQVQVTDAVYTGTTPIVTIDNQATITIDTHTYTTNVTHNPPEYKVVQPSAASGALKVGDTLTYTITWHNDSGDVADVTITDIIPAGTTLVDPDRYNSTDEKGNSVSYDAASRTITWVIANADANATGTVDFTVYVDASAQTTIENDAKIQIGNNDPRQTNETTNTVGEGDIKLSKAVVAEDANKATDKTFTLNLTEQSGKLNGTYSNVTFTNGKATVTLTAGNSVTISDLPLGVTILVSEDLTNTPGWTPSYAPSTQSVVAAAPDADGNVPTLTVTNDFTPAPVTFQLKGSKTFSGPFPAGEYTFAFTAQQKNVTENNDETAPETVADQTDNTRYATATVTGSSGTLNFAFDAVTFTQALDTPLYYLVKEVYSQHAGVITDTNEYLLKLQIVDDTAGSLKAVAAYSKKDAGGNWGAWQTDWDATKEGDQTWKDVLDGTSPSPITFTNIYPEPTSVTITGTKTLTGRNITADDSFIFELLDENMQPLANTGLAGTITGEKNTENFQFLRHYAVTDLVVNGTRQPSRNFTYYIRETAMNAEGMTYDSTLYKVVVTVSLGTDNNLSASVTSINKVTTTDEGEALTSANAITFANTFTPNDISLSLATTKTLTGAGAYALNGGEFSFSVYQTDSDFAIDSEAKLVAGGSNGAATDSTSNTANVNLGTITYVPADMSKNAEGDYTTTEFFYVVKENIPSKDLQNYDYSMTYSTVTYKVKVTVNVDATTGQLSIGGVTVDDTAQSADANGIYKIAPGFENKRVPDTTTAKPEANKVTVAEQNNVLPNGLSFSFVVRPAEYKDNKISYDSSSVATTGLSEPTDASGGNKPVSTFGAITYTAAQLGKETTRDFYYVIEESNAAANNHNGITYDSSKYVWKVTLSRVTDTTAEDFNELKAIGTYYKLNADNTLGEALNSAPTFNNKYDSQTSINLTATKTLTGRNMAADEFDFRLQRLEKKDGATAYTVVSGSAVDGTNAAANSGNEGTVTFGTLYFRVKNDNQEGNITPADLVKSENNINVYRAYYLMSEIPETAVAGVTSGGQQYIVTIELTHDTTLTAKLVEVHAAEFVDGGYQIAGNNLLPENFNAEETPVKTHAIFTNTYNADPAEATITANKVLTGRALRAGEFTFNLYREGVDGVLATATNDASGNITFKRTYSQNILPTSAFDSDGNYTIVYRLEEAPVSTGGVTPVPDTATTYWVKVVIHHNVENGTYTASTPEYYADYDAENKVVKGDPISAITFHNQYKTTGTTFKPVVNKVMLNAVDKTTKLPIPEQKFNFNVFEGTTLVGSGSTKASTAPEGTTNHVSEIDFTPIAINGTGNQTHIYRIEEIVGADATVTYNTAPIYVKVNVTDNGHGNLSAETVGYYTDEACTQAMQNVQITNYKSSGQVVVNLGVQKTVKIYEGTTATDRTYPLADSEFDFYVTETNDRNASAIADGTNAVDGKVVFDDIVITLADMVDDNNNPVNTKTFTYYIYERAKAGNTKLTTDTDYIVATVTVTKDDHKNLNYSVSYEKYDEQGNKRELVDTEKNLFINKYTHTAIPVVLTGTKTLIGKDLAKDEFSFQLYDSGDNLIKTVNNGVIEKNDANEDVVDVNKISFGELKFNAPGTYTYYVKEVKKNAADTDPGTYGYDDKTIYVEVNVTEVLGQDGLAATVSYYTKDAEGNKIPYSGIAFTNTYSPKAVPLDINVPFKITKTIVDESGNPLDMPLGGFQFELVGLLDQDGKPVTVTGTSAENGTVDFAPIYFTEPGPFTFTIVESAKQPEGKQGYLVDGAQWVVNVLVNYNDTTAPVTYTNVSGESATAASGELYIKQGDVKVQKVDLSAQETDETTPALLANGAKTPVTFVNTYNPVPTSVTVTATKNLTGRDLRSGEFSFRLVSGNIIAAQATNDADGKITFQLNYTGKDMAGAKVDENTGWLTKTFTYTMKEVGVTTEAPGVSIDTTTYTVTVTVVDDDGQLKANVSVSGNATFTNIYTPKPVDVPITATKVITGWDLAHNTFDFLLTPADAEFKPIDGAVSYKARNDADGNILFKDDGLGGIRFEKAGMYHFVMTEVDGGIEGMSYDGSAIGVAVEVTDDLNGKLIASEPRYSEAPVFLNVYEGDEAVVSLQASKILNGRELKAGEFNFQLLDSSGAVISEAKNDAEGKIVFAPFHLAQTGTYTYTIREDVSGGVETGMTCDRSEYKVTVTVTQANDGSYQAAVAYDTADGKAPTFVNRFTQSNVTLQAKKILEGRALKAGEFSFQLLDEQGNLLQTKTNDAKGNITFDSLALYTAGTYTYTILEVPGKEAGMTYDSTKVTVTVKASQNAAGTLDTEITYKGGEIPTFVNTYDVEAVTLQAKKILEGRTLKAGEFSFQLLDQDGKVLQTKKNDAAGNITFDAINLYTKGTYKYTIQEVAGSEKGMTYDAAKVAVTVKVKQTLKGELETTVTYETDDGKAPTFVNQYMPAPAKVTVTANKKLTGRSLIAGEFTFRLMDGKNVVAETRNAADGTVAFDLTYTAKDLNGSAEKTYEYTIVEVIPEADKAIPGVAYDTSSAKVSVTLKDNGGQMEVNGKTEALIESGKTFTNAYTADSAPVVIKATKKLEGWNLTDSGAAFRFLLTPVDAEGKVIEGGKVLSASNDAQGNIVFPELVYELSDLDGKDQKTFYYQISEEAGTVSGMVYDKTQFSVSVTVTNEGKGYLSTDVKYETEPVFVNQYQGAAAPVTIRAKKVLDTEANRKLKAGEFTFQLLDSKGKVVSEATNDAKGNVSFETFTLTETGTYSYTIQEVAGKETGMRYDKSKEKVTVEVTQTADGSYQAKVIYDTEDGKAPVFVNEYDPQPAKITLTGTKKLYGRTLRRAEFKFQVRDSKGNLVAEGKNDRKGNILFDEMEFANPGTYVLKVSEVKGKTRYMTYDTDVFTVTVTVTEDNGVLSASAVAAKEVIFQNYYTPPYSNPKTGDEMPLIPMMLMMLTSGAALAAVLVLNKKRRSR